MDAAEDRAERGAPSGVVVVAGEQTRGKGQRGRRWMAPAGTSLLMTTIARPDCDPERLPEIPGRVGQCVGHAVCRLTGVSPAMKPPNDLMVEDRKMAGILCQSSIEGRTVRYVLIGIGINVNINRDDLPLSTATSLQIETGRTWNLNLVLNGVLDELERCWCFEDCRNAQAAC